MISTAGAKAGAPADQPQAEQRAQLTQQQQQAGQGAALRRQKRAQAKPIEPKIPMPAIETELRELIYSEMRQQAQLSEK